MQIMSEGLNGLFLVTAAGVCWIGIGISVSVCAARNWNYSIVQGVSCLGAALICGLILAADSFRALPGQASVWGLLMSCAAGLANFYTYVFASKAMRRGPNGLVWGVMQAGMIGSFLMGVLFFGEKASLLRLTGLILILGGILLMGLAKNKSSSEKGGSWIFPALGAFLLVMTGHCCNALPSYFPETAGTGAVSRTLGMYTGGAVGFFLTTLPGMIRKREFGGKGEWSVAAVLAILNISASGLFFYRGLDLLARNGCGGLGYPVAIGVCVTGFSLYSLLILKEKCSPPSLAGLAAVCLGIIFIAMR